MIPPVVSPWSRRAAAVFTCAVLAIAATAGAALLTLSALYHVYLGRDHLPDLGPFTRFEFPTIGHVYDARGQPLIEFAREYRQIVQFADIPPIVRDAILATEDKRFFSHNGVDYLSAPRVIGKVRVGAWATRLITGGRRDNMSGPAIFPQGGSTITQQLVRGVFLLRTDIPGEQLPAPQRRPRASRAVGPDRRPERQHGVPEARRDSTVAVGRRTDAAAVRVEAPREGGNSRPLCQLRVHGERPVRICAGGGILLRPAALSTFTADDADKAALLARHRQVASRRTPRPRATAAPSCAGAIRSLALMAADGFISRDVQAAVRAAARVAGVSHALTAVPGVGCRRACSRRTRGRIRRPRP